jgi:hypothetical protein
LKLKDTVSELKTKSEASVSGIASVDSSGVVSKQTADIDTRTWIEDKFIVDISHAAAAEILRASDIIFRFYFGPIPVTYKLEGYKLRSVQNTLKD